MMAGERSKGTSREVVRIDPGRIRAVIFDMDGVITDTARLHARAWKEIFDAFLRERADAGGAAYAEFTMDDYLRYVDGKPRRDGVRDFLAARGITLAEGDSEDGAELETVHGLGRRKDERFRGMLAAEGVSPFEDTVTFLERLRAAGLRVAAISSSRNAEEVLRAAGVRERFEVLIDGRVSAERGIAGKPAPDIFLEAARAIGVEPESAAIAEDAISGVSAGRRGGFAIVIGVARNGDGEGLERAGADAVIGSFDEVSIVTQLRRREALPDALAAGDELMRSLRSKPLRIFLDYDGTLTPIVSRPEDAVLCVEMRRRLERVAARHFLAIVSGRGLDELRRLVGIDGIAFAGSHGFELMHTDGSKEERSEAQAALPLLERLAAELEGELADLAGLQLERKRFGLAVHYRRVGEAEVARVEEAVAAADGRYAGLKIKSGKKVFEFVPALDWDKGRALEWIEQRLGDAEGAVSIYIGDDVTDEDAFRALEGKGVAIAVGDGPEATSARWKLDDVDAVGLFLERLVMPEDT